MSNLAWDFVREFCPIHGTVDHAVYVKNDLGQFLLKSKSETRHPEQAGRVLQECTECQLIDNFSIKRRIYGEALEKTN